MEGVRMILKSCVTEAQVIAEFLKNEFYQKEYDKDRREFESIVLNPDITDDAQNIVRRALLYRRRGHMLREITTDTVWQEADIDAEDLTRISVFSRAHWSKALDGLLLLSG